MPTILVVDDEPQIRRTVGEALRALPARVIDAPTAKAALESADREQPDLIVLDLGLPDRPGLDVCTEIRRSSNMPIVVLSARHTESEKVQLLNAGADDYVSKPFGLGELVARVRAQLRRVHLPKLDRQTIIVHDGLEIDLTRRTVRRDGDKIKLTPTEWSIFETLVEHGGRPVSHQRLFDAVWGRPFGNPQQYLRVFVTHLRRKVERNPAVPTVVITEPGFGYRFGIDDG